MERGPSERITLLPVASEQRRLMSVETTAIVSAALERYTERGVLDSRLRPAARCVCDDARSSDLRVEQMLVALKSEWNAILEQNRIPHGVARTDLTSRFITLCIHAFYESQPGPRSMERGVADGARMQA